MHHLKSLLGSEMCWLKGWSGCGAAGLPKAYTPAIPQEAAAPVEFTLPPLPAVQLPDKDLINKPLHHYSKKKDGPLVIYAPIFDGLSSNSVTSTISNVVTPNDYTIIEPSRSASASGSANAGSSSSSSTPRCPLSSAPTDSMWPST